MCRDKAKIKSPLKFTKVPENFHRVPQLVTEILNTGTSVISKVSCCVLMIIAEPLRLII